jgi:hypothetical protein
MNRLQFIQKSFLLLLGLKSFANTHTPSQDGDPGAKKEVLKSYIRGFKYYHGKKVLPLMKAGDTLDLVREPNNPYDPQAIAIYWQGQKLGYVAMESNEGVAMILDYELKDLKVNITRIDTQAPLWECVEYTIYL